MASADASVPGAESPRLNELDRLERAVRELVAQRDELQAENTALEKRLEDGLQRLQAAEAAARGLEQRLLAEERLRGDAVSRIDDLVGLVEQLDTRLTGGER